MACMQISDLEIKKMVYLYLVNYAKAKPELVLMAVNSFIRVGLSFLSLLQA
jgi:AP-1 complex subunit beta-1